MEAVPDEGEEAPAPRPTPDDGGSARSDSPRHTRAAARSKAADVAAPAPSPPPPAPAPDATVQTMVQTPLPAVRLRLAPPTDEAAVPVAEVEADAPAPSVRVRLGGCIGGVSSATFETQAATRRTRAHTVRSDARPSHKHSRAASAARTERLVRICELADAVIEAHLEASVEPPPAETAEKKKVAERAPQRTPPPVESTKPCRGGDSHAPEHGPRDQRKPALNIFRGSAGHTAPGFRGSSRLPGGAWLLASTLLESVAPPVAPPHTPLPRRPPQQRQRQHKPLNSVKQRADSADDMAANNTAAAAAAAPAVAATVDICMQHMQDEEREPCAAVALALFQPAATEAPAAPAAPAESDGTMDECVDATRAADAQPCARLLSGSHMVHCHTVHLPVGALLIYCTMGGAGSSPSTLTPSLRHLLP